MGSGLHTAPVGSGWRIFSQNNPEKLIPAGLQQGWTGKKNTDTPPEAQIQEDLAYLEGNWHLVRFYKVI